MTQPVVSYVVAARNHDKYIGDLLESICNQTFAAIQVAVIDDGSTDHTVSIAQKAAHRDPRITVYPRPHTGIVAARNFGMKQTSAPYVSIVDSDERLPLDRTKKMVEVLSANPQAVMVYGDAEIRQIHSGRVVRFFDVYPPKPGPFSETLFSHYCFVPAGSVMFRRDAWERSGEFWGPGPNTDYIKWIELGMQGDAICLRQELLGTWILHGSNLSQGTAETRCAQYDALCQALMSLASKYPYLSARVGQHRRQRRYGRCYFMAGFYAGLESKWSLARHQFKMAIQRDRSFFNAVGLISTLPPINYLSQIGYRLAARRFLADIV